MIFLDFKTILRKEDGHLYQFELENWCGVLKGAWVLKGMNTVIVLRHDSSMSGSI